MTARTIAAPRIAFLVPLLLVFACGATVEQSAPASPLPSTAIEEPSLTPVPAGPSGPPAEPTQFVPPTPVCPATFDAALPDPETGLTAHEGDRLTLALPPGWQFLRWEGFDRPAVGDGGNVWPPIDTPQRPTTIEVPVPFRPGASIAGYTLTITNDDGRIVGTLEIRFMTSLPSS